MSGPLPRWIYRRLGRRYPLFILALQFSVAHVVVLVGSFVLTLYLPMSLETYLRILIAAELLIMVENFFATRLSHKMLRPVDEWIGGRRDAAATERAWRVLAELPAEFLDRWKWVPIGISVVPVSVYITVELGLPVWALVVLLVTSFGVLVYGAILRFFAMELAMRPVLEDVSRELPESFEMGRGGFPLRWKLLAMLPMTVITAAIVAGLANEGRGGVAELGLDVLIAIAVGLTISLEAILLLSRSILTPIDNLREATKRLAAGDLGARVALVSTDETGRLAQSFNRMAAGLEERERLREAFGAFVDPQIAERVMSDGAVRGEEVEVSVLFLDIRGFTAYAEAAEASEVVARLNDFYERVVPVLTKHGGHANKFIGDGLLGVFGAPERHADHADRALAAAVEIARLVRECYGEELRVGIGVNSGPVLAGTIGGGGRLDFTVIGDAVNTASRVETATRETGDDVLITEATRRLLGRVPECELVEREPVELRGKTEDVRLWAPVIEVGAEHDGDGVLTGLRTLGRRLRPDLATVRGGHSQPGR